ncbi:MAG TPA: hypothetical protein VHW69_12975 [Rhizomicrobium sp.]|nr:hypothetical protein [Rhizomicrobium sp.]
MRGILKVALSATALVGSGLFATAWAGSLYSGFYQVSGEPLGRSYSGAAAHPLIPVDQLAKAPAGAHNTPSCRKPGRMATPPYGGGLTAPSCRATV